MHETGEDRLQSISDALTKGEPQHGETVRTLLSWFDAQRRGPWIVARIRQALEDSNLITAPDFESAYVDSVVEFQRPKDSTESPPAFPPEQLSGAASIRLDSSGSLSESSSQPPARVPSPDPSFRLRQLPAANQSPVFVTPDATLAEAVTIMLSHDYSQLPVMTNIRDIKGVISWSSIASRLTMGHDGAFVRDFMEPEFQILESTASFFEAIRVIAERNYVLVRGQDRSITGIVTSADVSLQIQSLAEPFLLLAEIENDLRRALHAKFSVEELATAKDPADTRRTIVSAHDMNFGEYVHLLENPTNWAKFSSKLDRATFVNALRRISAIRNDVMHFDPDPLDADALETLRSFSRFSRRLRDLRAT